MNISIINGIGVAVIAVILVVARVLWPKETMQRKQEEKRFQTSVREMREGLDHLEDEQYDQAMELFQVAATQTPNKPAPVLLRIYTLGLQGRQREAQMELQSALKKWPVESLPSRLLALAYLGSGRYDRAYTSAQNAAAQTPIASSSLVTMGDVCRLTERFPEAERFYLSAIEYGAHRPIAGLASVLANQGRVAEAEAELAHASERTLSLFESQLALAVIHAQARRVDDAIAVYASLMDDHRHVPRVVAPYGLLLLEAGEKREALQLLSNAVERSGDDPFIHCALATVLVSTGELAGATVHVREALRLWPNFGNARGIFGDILKRSGRYDAAEEQYRDALKCNPFLADVHAKLGSLLRTNGKLEEAREHEREASRLRPSYPLPITQEVLAIRTELLASGAHPVVAPRTAPPATRPRDLDVVMRPTMRELPSLAWKPNDEPVLPPPDAATLPPPPARPFLSSDIVVFPGAALLLDESSDAIFMQRLQTRQPPQLVRDYYIQHMGQLGWQQSQESASIFPDIRGVTIQWQRQGQRAQITIGLQPQRTEVGEPISVIVTQVAHRS